MIHPRRVHESRTWATLLGLASLMFAALAVLAAVR